MYISHPTLSNGQYVTCSIRRANYTNLYFGWFSIWRTKSHFDKGICKYSIDNKNILLGNSSEVKENALNFIIEHEDIWADELNKMLLKGKEERNGKAKELQL